MASSVGCDRLRSSGRSASGGGPPDGRDDRGQSTVELALSLPLVCLLVLAVVQVALIVRDQLLVLAAAREGARAASVSASPTVAASRAVGSRGLRPLHVSTSTTGSSVTVTVRYVDPTDVPLVGALLPEVVVEESVTMALEPP